MPRRRNSAVSMSAELARHSVSKFHLSPISRFSSRSWRSRPKMRAAFLPARISHSHAVESSRGASVITAAFVSRDYENAARRICGLSPPAVSKKVGAVSLSRDSRGRTSRRSRRFPERIRVNHCLRYAHERGKGRRSHATRFSPNERTHDHHHSRQFWRAHRHFDGLA